MLKLLSRKLNHHGMVSYRGTLTPRAEEYAFLMKQGLDVKLAKTPADGASWTLILRHKDWGEAKLSGLPNASPIPKPLLEFTINLTDREKAEAAAAGVSVGITLTSSRDNVLRDRKNLFRFMRAVMSDDAVVAGDAGSMLFWSRAALDDEVAMNAELDVAALYCIHAVHKEDEQPYWLHTHGLAEVGGFDVDILGPSESIANGCGDLFRALAYAILDGDLKPDSDKVHLAHPGGDIRLVPVPEFHAKAAPADRELHDQDEYHRSNRSIACDPGGGLFGKFKKIRRSTFLSNADTDRMVVLFTNAATDAMSARARATIGTLSGLMEELREFDLPVLAKIGYERDGGDGGEHMWFTVHGIDGDSIDATLESSPFHIEHLKQGHRGLHSVSRLTEWTIMSPFGRITPDSLTPLRRIREDKDGLRKIMKEANAG
jgi:hypothetical protein